MNLGKVDPEIADITRAEKERQKSTVNLIASENYVSRAVLEAQGSVLTNKYAEGYPGRRYYGGCENMDRVEEIAVRRAKELFDAEHANVQPYSGSIANVAAYLTLLEEGGLLMGMSLSQGGHLTHGSQVNFSGRFYRVVHYGVDKETGWLDYDEVEKLALKHRPDLIVVGSSSYPRQFDFKRFREIADRVGARLMADIAHPAGLIAAGLYPSPVPYAEVVTATTHKTMRGPRGGLILCRQEYAKAIDQVIFPGLQGGPLMHVIAAKAVAFQEASQPEFVNYQRRVLENAKVLAQELQSQGLKLVTGGTDTHRILVDLRSTGITGEAAEEALGRVGIVVNKNLIPYDPRSPRVASGIRLGTPAVTTRGFGPEEMRLVARLIAQVLSHLGEPAVEQQVRQEVRELALRFPAPGIDD